MKVQGKCWSYLNVPNLASLNRFVRLDGLWHYGFRNSKLVNVAYLLQCDIVWHWHQRSSMTQCHNTPCSHSAHELLIFQKFFKCESKGLWPIALVWLKQQFKSETFLLKRRQIFHQCTSELLSYCIFLSLWNPRQIFYQCWDFTIFHTSSFTLVHFQKQQKIIE